MKKNQIKGICRYCGKESILCNAHILPKSFYRLDLGKRFGDPYNKNPIYQNGLKDNNILCSTCDGILGEYDKEASRILIKEINKHNSEGFKTLYTYEAKEFNYKKLRYFLISLLWRTSISTLPQLAEFNIGKYEDIALKILKGEIPDNSNMFGTYICKRPKNDNINEIVLFKKNYIQNKPAYAFSFPDYLIIIMPEKESILGKYDAISEDGLFFCETCNDVFGIKEDLKSTFPNKF